MGPHPASGSVQSACGLKAQAVPHPRAAVPEIHCLATAASLQFKATGQLDADLAPLADPLLQQTHPWQ